MEFWTEVASGKKAAAREITEGWWNQVEFEMGLDGCLEDVFWRLREGGWREEEVKDMMMMNSHDRSSEQNRTTFEKLRVSSVCEILLSGGWSRDDVLYSLDLEDKSAIVIPEEESTFEINVHDQPIRIIIPQVERKNKPKSTAKHAPIFFAAHKNLIL